MGIVENLLCGECEQKLSTLEDYAKRFFYGNSKPLRLQLPLLEEPVYFADYQKMKLFQLSLLWRASEAKGAFFEAVKLSDVHRERLRVMLLHDEPGEEEEYFCAMSRFVASRQYLDFMAQHGISIETGCFAPVCHNHPGWSSFLFVMGGIAWLFCVSSIGVPEIMRNIFLTKEGRFHLTALNGDAFLYQFALKTILAGNVTRRDAEESLKAKQRKEA